MTDPITATDQPIGFIGKVRWSGEPVIVLRVSCRRVRSVPDHDVTESPTEGFA